MARVISRNRGNKPIAPHLDAVSHTLLHDVAGLLADCIGREPDPWVASTLSRAASKIQAAIQRHDLPKGVA